MAVLPITKHPDPLLREKSREVTLDELKSPETQTLIDDMIETMWDVDGIGLAGVQVGKPIRLAIITENETPIVIVNPVVKKRSFKKEPLGQGCLSVPGYNGTVRRPRSITISALNREGEEMTFTGEGLVSHIIQHEIDHMNGTLFFDKAKNLEPGHPDDKND